MSNKPQEVLELEAKIRSSRYDNYKVIALLILNKTPEELERIRQVVSPTFRGLLSLSYLKRNNLESVFGSGYNVEKDAVDIYGILLYLFRYHATFIQKYVDFRNQTYDSLLRGEYKNAEELIGNIDKMSRSLWAERMKLAILKLKNDDDAYSNYFEKLDTKQISNKLRFILRHTHNTLNFNPDDNSRSEKNVRSVIETGIKSKNLQQFYKSYCCPFDELETENWLSLSMNSSIIDMYECMLVSLRHLSKETISSERFKSYIIEINQLITDNMLQRWCALEYFPCASSTLDDENIELQQYYYSGDFANLWKKGFKYIQSHPRDVNTSILLAKSVSYSQSADDVDYGLDNKTLAGQILLSMIAMLCYNKEKMGGTNAVLGVSYSLNFILELRTLYFFAQNYQNVFLDQLHDNCWRYSPTMSFYDSSKYIGNTKEDYISQWKNYCKLTDEKFHHLIESLYTPEMCPLQTFENHNISVDKLLLVLEQKQLPAYLQNGIASYIYNTLLTSKQYDKALTFYVDKTISDRAIDVRRRPEIEDTISDSFDLMEQYPLDMSIFRTMTDMPDYERFDAYLTFLENMGVKKASELNIDKNNKKMLYFLSDVCDLQVLWQHVDVLKSSQLVYEERLKICKKLLEVNQSKRISREISEIIQQQQIKALTRKVDESKIYADVNAIRKKELEDVHTYYDLFLNVDALCDDSHEFVSDDADDESKYFITSADVEKMRRTLFFRIFYAVRDKFLYDPKFGLEFFLSTRIRHGTLMNQLRHSFEAYDLVTRKDTAESYSPDHYWSEVKFDLNYSGRNKIKSFIDTFTRVIDKNILSVKDEFIQIQTEQKAEKQHGVFNFNEDIINDVILEAYSELPAKTSFSEMISLIFDKLWKHTSICLMEAKRRLDEFSDKCTHALDQLDQDVCGLFSEHYNSEFHNVIVDCKTMFNRDVDIVKDWFQLKNTADFDFQIKDAYVTSLNYVNSVHQRQLHVNESIKADTIFYHRSHFIALYDMFSDMFNNACNYALERKHNQKSLDARMDILEDNTYLHIIFSNLVDREDEAKILEVIEERKANASKHLEQGVSHSDRKTGIVRMMIITKNSFGNPDNEFDVKLENHRFVVSIRINKQPLIV